MFTWFGRLLETFGRARWHGRETGHNGSSATFAGDSPPHDAILPGKRVILTTPSEDTYTAASRHTVSILTEALNACS